MNEVWNLEPIYKGFSDPAFARDYESLKALVQELKTFSDGLEGMEPLAGLTRGIALAEELTRLVEKLAEYASLRQSADTRDQEAGSQMGRIMALCSDTAAPLAAFSQWASSLENLQELVAGDENLRDYGYYFENMKKSSRYLLPGMGEEIMARMELSGGNAWADLHSYITSTLPVKYRDKTINLSAVRNMAYDEDAQVRKDAYEAELAAYPAIRDSAAFALNSIKLETISDCKLRGYTSPLDRTLENSHMEKKTLTAMLEAMDQAGVAYTVLNKLGVTAEAFEKLIRERIGAIECEARKRAADLEESTQMKLHRMVEQFHQQYTQLMSTFNATATHVNSELRKVEVTLTQLPRALDCNESELKELASALEQHQEKR